VQFRTILVVLYGMCLLLIFGADLSAAPLYDPSVPWNTLETEHFSIHYIPELRAIAWEFAGIAETMQAILAERIGWEEPGKTQLVITDTADSPNGNATIFPYKTVNLRISPPEADSALDDSADWFRTLFTHEYTHILQLDMVHGIPRWLRAIFGNVVSPNSLQPIWMIEGYATYQETKRSARGRGRATYSEMLLRSASLAGEFPAIDQASGGQTDWPAGAIPYIFGVKFHQYLEARFGEAALTQLYQEYSGRLIPYCININAKKVLGQRLPRLWREWQQDLAKKYEDQAKQLRQSGLTPSRNLTQRGFYIKAPRFLRNGRQIVYSEVGRGEAPSIRQYDLDSGRDTQLLTDRFASAMAVSPDGQQIAYAMIGRYQR
jgi:hypothetical protein